MKGTVMKSAGLWYKVLGADNRVYTCRIRGKLRLEGIKESNPIAVGDHVNFELSQQDGNITELLPRHNLIERLSVKKTAHSSVLAANLDQVLLIATLKQPRTSLGFIDRFLVTAESFRIPQILIFNKTDILSEDERDKQEQLAKLYSNIGVEVLSISALHDDDLGVISNLLAKKTTLVAGHSGVGKSTLLNKLSPNINQEVNEISEFSETGTHTTTYAEMFSINADTFIIDTPGVREWGLVDMNEQELSDYFPEMRDRRLNCKYGARCIHTNEPQCAVLDGVKNGSIALSRYESYLSMLAGHDNRK
ncbi:MAG: ribosome small subunit-dependent GTPase A [Cyclobacteriaceae bacterium]